MNLRLICKLLGIVAMLIGVMMIFSLWWAHPALGHRTRAAFPTPEEVPVFELRGFLSICLSIVICLTVAAVLWWIGRSSQGMLYRKEAMAVVGLSWALATVLGALPFYFSGTYLGPAVRLFDDGQRPQINGHEMPPLTAEQFRVVQTLLQAGARGLDEAQLKSETQRDDAPELFRRLVSQEPDWQGALMAPEQNAEPSSRGNRFRIRPLKMSFADAIFESQSGFSTTGATVISDLEEVPHCILFWRSSTHFLGGLGIIVLFVAILGQGSAGKALMRAEMPGPSKEGSQTRMQHTAWNFAFIFCGLTAALSVVLMLLGMSGFDAICHAFGTMATGGFSTYNASIGQFDSMAIETVVIVFMVLAGTNFTLLYLLCLGRPGRLLVDVEWRTYVIIIIGVTALVVLFGIRYGDFRPDTTQADPTPLEQVGRATRYGLFQVVSIITTTGYGTDDFNRWNSFGRGILFLLMFVGGCAGSTGGGMKVIRHILFHRILWLEVEQSFHPNVIRPLRLGGENVEDNMLRKNILVYFGLILVIFVFSWMLLVAFEPDTTWGASIEHKLIDSASAISATLNNIGPGLGIIGATENYANFSTGAKLLFTWLMMLGRLEIFVVLVLFVPNFWRSW